MPERAIYIWRLKPILDAEGGVAQMVQKAKRAHISQLWVKIADGRSHFANVRDGTGQHFHQLIDLAHKADIEVWGWQVPYCASEADADAEVATMRTLAKSFHLDGLIMDAEGGPAYFKGDLDCARRYGAGMRKLADEVKRPLAISSNDIPSNIEGWMPRFNAIAAHAVHNFPQTYYGSSPSVVHRVDRAERDNAHLTIPFSPVGAAWIGDGGGCASASACAERAERFIALAAERHYPIYGFWHWGGAPLAFWEVLNRVPA
jgi:hypothetical protein